MNNYCTNCGNKLKTYDAVCNECKTPILNIPLNYKYTPPKTKKHNKKIISILFITTMIIFAFFLFRFIYIKTTSEILKKKYVIPFLEERYGKYYSNLKFDMYGKCVISGECYTEPFIECDGNGCELYEYLSRFKCMSFYYNYEVLGNIETLSVYKMDGEYNISGGRNIYGYDDIYSDNYLKDEEEYDEYIEKDTFIKQTPYESDYIPLNKFFSNTFKVMDMEKITIRYYYNDNNSKNSYNSIHVYNQSGTEAEIKSKITIKTFDQTYNEIKTYYMVLNDFNYFKDIILDENLEKYIKIYIGDKYE